MDTTICLHSETAFELLRRWDLAVPNLFNLPRASSLRSCRIPSALDIEDRLSLLGLHGRPVHLMVGDSRHSHAVHDVERHVRTRPLPARSLIRIGDSVLCPTPELCFAQLAEQACKEGAGKRGGNGFVFKRFPWLDEVDLALKGFELCGTYLVDEQGEDHIRNTGRALTSVTRIASMLRLLAGSPGVAFARRALGFVQDGSHSLMETAMALQLTGPRRIGGVGLERGELNVRIETSKGPRWVDLGWVSRKLGLEYLGRAWHADVVRDDRRRNKLAGAGMSIITVRFKDLSDIQLFQELVDDIADVLGTRVRIRDREFRARQRALWSKVLPPVQRCI